MVRSMFLKVNMEHIQYIVSVLNQYGFIITTLYNSVLTLDAYYVNLAQVDN